MVHASEAGKPAGNGDIGISNAGHADLPGRFLYTKSCEKLVQSTVKHLFEFPAELSSRLEKTEMPVYLVNASAEAEAFYSEADAENHFASVQADNTESFDAENVNTAWNSLVGTVRRCYDVVIDIPDYEATMECENDTFTASTGSALEYYLFTPAAVAGQEEKTAPMVVGMHGNDNSALTMAVITEWPTLAEANGFVYMGLNHCESMTDDEINAEIAAAQAELESRGVAAEEPVEEGYQTLQKGSKGDEVKALQQRLIELNYLSGSADGDYGGKTASAVELFQSTAGLTATGIADADTQTALFADDAPKAKVYQSLDYKAMSRDPDTYEGNLYKFDGKVVQVMEQSQTDGTTLVALRVASKGRYDDVVYVIYYRGSGEARILEDDKVTVYGTSKGLYTYETVMGAEVTIPMILADSVTVK